MEFQPSLPESRMAMGVASFGTMLWIAGGLISIGDDILLSNTVWCFDRKISKWTRLTDLPLAMAFPKLLVDRGKLICLGGAVRSSAPNNGTLESIQDMYRLEHGQWVRGNALPEKCHNLVATIVAHNIYVFGGFNTHTMSQIRHPFFYDAKEDKWNILQNLPEEASGFIVAATRDQH
ncbi:Beta-scruin, partial [Stegodyphus mimosarum]